MEQSAKVMEGQVNAPKERWPVTHGNPIAETARSPRSNLTEA